jgi:uncharacterized repeat protein (TIGR03803 family)
MKTNVLISVRRHTAVRALVFFSLVIFSGSTLAQSFTVLHKFTGGADGGNSFGGVIVDPNGNLYGTTYIGGAFGYGTLFKLDPAGKETVLQSFMGSNGLWPGSGLLRDSEGNLYGTTPDGGTSEGGGCVHGCGTVFTIDKTGKETVLYAFTGGADGRNPDAALIRDAAGNLYGTTLFGGGSGWGTVFKLDSRGKETVLHSFTGKTDGGYANSLIRDRAGNLYGTASLGGDLSCSSPYGCGVVFKLNASGKFTVLYGFTGAGAALGPAGRLVRDASGNLYGTTVGAAGTVFKLDTNLKLTVLHAFNGNGAGVNPVGGIVMDRAGNFYGATAYGGNGNCHHLSTVGCGAIFKLTP